MKSVGFPISHKENENRRAIVPEDIKKISHPEMLYFEIGYGNVLGIEDKDYINAGANVVSREEVLKKNVVCDPKIGDAEYLENLSKNISGSQNLNLYILCFTSPTINLFCLEDTREIIFS